jgi:phospholipid/cholesterol/gamma-HCH transport system permease protein
MSATSASRRRASNAGRCEVEHGEGELRVRLSGRWLLHEEAAAPDAVLAELPPAARLVIDASAVEAWDSTLVAFVLRVRASAAASGMDVDESGLPEGLRLLLALMDSAPVRAQVASHRPDATFLDVVGAECVGFIRSAGELVSFFGEVVLAFARLVAGRTRMRGRDLLLLMQQVGAEALPIVSLISVLVGLILAYVGAIQLAQFGAGVYVADLVAIAMAREMAGMMTGIVMAGRTGAAFAAQLGTMTVNEEIDALRTAAVPPIDFLVLPRMLALVLMMPLLTLYATVMGMLGGGIIGVTLLDLAVLEYLNQTRNAVDLVDLATGLFKAAVYGVIVGVSGCLRGLQCARSAAAVGEVTTSAVVTGIVFIVIASATLTVIYQILGI